MAGRLKTLYCLLLAVSILAAGGSRLFKALGSVSIPAQLDYAEGIVAYQAQQLANPQVTYRIIDTYPFFVTHYPPLYHLALRGARHLFSDWLIAGRIVSLASLALTAAAIAAIVWFACPRRLGLPARGGAAGFAAASVLVLPVTDWASLARVDLLAMALIFTALALFTLKPRQAWAPYAAMALTVAAVYTKQTSLAAPAALLLVTAAVSLRRAAMLALFGFGLGLVPLLYLQWWTGRAFLENIVGYNRNPYFVRQWISLTSQNIETSWPYIVLAAAAVMALAGPVLTRPDAAARWRALRARLDRPGVHRAVLIAGLHAAIAWLITPTSGKEGAGSNYFLEANYSSCLLAGFALAPLLSRWDRTPPSFPAVNAVRLLAVAVLLAGALANFRDYFWTSPHTGQQIALEQGLENLIRRTDGIVYSENMAVLVRTNREIPWEPAILTELTRVNRWDETPLVEMIRNRKLALMIVRHPISPLRYSPAVAEAIAGYYEPTEDRFGDHVALRPRRAAAQR